MCDVIRCALCGDEIEDPIQTEKGELCEKCIADLLTEQKIVSLPDDVFLKPIVLNEDRGRCWRSANTWRRSIR